MTPLTSERHFFNFYGSIVFIILLGGGIELLVGLTFWERYANQTFESRDICLVPIGGLPLLIILFTLPGFLKNVPTIKLDDHKITFKPILGKAKTYNLQDIQSLKLTGKKPFLPLNDAPLEGAQIVFQNGQNEFIFDRMYANSRQFKSWLQELVLGEKVRTSESGNIDFRPENEQVQYFKGNQFTSFHGLLLWGLTLVLTSIPLTSSSVPPIRFLYLAVLIISCFLLFSWMIHYFGLLENYLIVRNHTLPWVNRRFYLPNIKEVVFEQEGKRPYSLCVITQDFKSKLYPAGTLKVKHWLSLKSELEKNNIPVRNECVPDDAYPPL